MTRIKMSTKILFSLFFNITLLWSSAQAQSQQLWGERCSRHVLALNDCNWCQCKSARYECSKRDCRSVDMFGHFNDAIQKLDVGMEGHGVWRSRESQCEAGVHYIKDDLLCVCTEDGTWPNPVCRDTFQVLHSVEPTKYNKPDNQRCSPNRLYQIGCNVCYCLSSGVINPNHCTKMDCNDHVVDERKPTKTKIKSIMPVEVYATCTRGKSYTIDCQTCVCLPNNRLLCDKCTGVLNEDNSNGDNLKPTQKGVSSSNRNTLCDGVEPGKRFQNQCNTCYCDENNIIYCTVLNCLNSSTAISIPQIRYEKVDAPYDDNECTPGTMYNKDCNTCHCWMSNGVKYFSCTSMQCYDEQYSPMDSHQCITGTRYEKNCLICQCVMKRGINNEICTYNEKCERENNKSIKYSRTSIKNMHGYCEPLHMYYKECNRCKCLSNGRQIACTSEICLRKTLDKPVKVQFIPFVLNEKPCVSGTTYHVDCNICYCLSNGNTICTTKVCQQ